MGSIKVQFSMQGVANDIFLTFETCGTQNLTKADQKTLQAGKFLMKM